MATYLLSQGCAEEEDVSIVGSEAAPVLSRGDPVSNHALDPLTATRGCGKAKKKPTQKKLLREEDLKEIMTRQVELAQWKEEERRLQGLVDGRLAYLQETHYTSDWKETGTIPPRGQRGDAGDFHGGHNIGSRTSIAGLTHYIPPIVDLPVRAAAYLEEHKILYLFQEILAEMLIRRPISPRKYLLEWIQRVRGPIEKPVIESDSPSETVCSSCCRLDAGGKKPPQRIELCDCLHSYEDMRTEAEKRKDIPLPPKLTDPQQWMWDEADLAEAIQESEKEKEEDEGTESSQTEPTVVPEANVEGAKEETTSETQAEQGLAVAEDSEKEPVQDVVQEQEQKQEQVQEQDQDQEGGVDGQDGEGQAVGDDAGDELPEVTEQKEEEKSGGEAVEQIAAPADDGGDDGKESKEEKENSPPQEEEKDGAEIEAAGETDAVNDGAGEGETEPAEQ